MKKNVLVTGGNGQLAQCIKLVAKSHQAFNVVVLDKTELDVTCPISISKVFNTNNWHYCINTAAFTNVENAEHNTETAYLVNTEGAANLAEACKKADVVLIQISTDYVFDGNKQKPYLETDPVKPLNKYGESKLLAENKIKQILNKHFIIRTSWLYAPFGKNFYTTMCAKIKENANVKVTSTQTGTPTHALDLASWLFKVMSQESKAYGVYHLTNAGHCTWYDFAKTIFENHSLADLKKLQNTTNYPTFAQRPKYSVLDCKKAINTWQIEPMHWQERLLKQLKDDTTN